MNEAFGWTWIFLGVVSGSLLGVGFLREGFLGGYAGATRRLLRLGHISFFGLGGINILFAHSTIAVPSAGEPIAPVITVASIALLAAGASMPVACGLVAWRRTLFPAFIVPVLAALVGTGVITWEMLT